MNQHDRISGWFWLGISIAICIAAVRMGIGTFRSPGPGFIFLLAGAFLGFLAILLVISNILGRKDRKKIIDSWKGMEWRKGMFFIISLSLYCIFLTKIGYLITTLALIGFLLGISRKQKLWIQWGSALVISLLSYLIFDKWLEIQLPKGIFSF